MTRKLIAYSIIIFDVLAQFFASNNPFQNIEENHVVIGIYVI